MPRKLIRRLQIGFGISVLILIISSGASFFSIKKQIKARENLLHTQRIIMAANQILIDLQNTETGQRGFYLTNDEAFLEPYYQSTRSLPQSLKETREMVKGNEVQSSRIDSISVLVNKWMDILTDLTRIKRRGDVIPVEQLATGKAYMDSCRTIINQFIQAESSQLNKQDEDIASITGYTSAFIVLAAIFSLVVALIFFLRIRGEVKRREKLQEAVRAKDNELMRRLAMVREVASRVSSGDYSVRVSDHENDDLGDIGNALDEMSANLEKSFEKINNNEWKQAGLARLNDILVGNKNPEMVAYDALAHLVNYGGNANGSIYLPEDEHLVLRGSYGLERHMAKRFSPGEGRIGQVFEDKCRKLWENIDNNDYVISFSSGQLRVSHILWLPLLVKDNCFGVIELGSTKNFQNHEIEFYEEACGIITQGIIAANGRKEVQTLLEETQSQSEELLVQHNELEKLNTELEAQAQKLQASEEELKAQQEDLLRSNKELEKRSGLLEEKNVLIAHRNVEIHKKAEELALSTRYKSEFLANMSHELRTPLNSILLLSRLMAENSEGNLSAEQVKSSQVIHSSGSSLLTLIDEILDLSKVEAGKMDLEYRPVDIAALCKGLDDMFSPITGQKGLYFDIRIDPLVPGTIETDQLRLEQVLRNLLNNAIKFTAEGGITLRISKDPARKDFIVFSVRDTGIGINGENQQVIFEAFRQADGSTKRKYGGTGLGLSISREITSLLGGEILLQSNPGQGSDFSIFIPTKREVADRVRSERKKILPGAGPDQIAYGERDPRDEQSILPENIIAGDEDEAITPDKKPAVLPGIKKVLIVEENARHAEALSYFLSSYNIGSEIRDTVEGCINALLSGHESCVILEALPDKTGYEVLETIRQKKGLEEVPVIIFTGKNLSGAEELKIRKYADSIVIKTAHSFRRILDEIKLRIHVAEEDDGSEKTGKPGRLGSLPEVLKGKTVLMADDDARNIFSVTRVLEKYQMKVIPAIDGKDALQKLHENPSIAVVLMDIMMPEMDGYKTIAQIRSMPSHARLPIIAVTAKAMTGDREKCIQAGASDYISKPVDVDQLLSLLRIWLYEP